MIATFVALVLVVGSMFGPAEEPAAADRASPAARAQSAARSQPFDGLAELWPWHPWSSEIVFRAKDRTVSNWRTQAVLHVETSPGTSAAILLGHDPPRVGRCVKLDNYWCIKRAGWAGEIASDPEGHVAFASAAEGALVAVLLLRRYYVDYKLHSARAIVERWAPASCGLVAVRRPARRGGPIAPIATAADHLATHGLRATLRGRFLAARGRRIVAGGRPRLHVSVVPDRLIGKPLPAATIALDLGKAAIPLAPGGRDLRPWTAAMSGAANAGSGSGCAEDATRIDHYARRVAAAIAAAPTDDLHLFDADGRPTANLGRVMKAMSAVEIGPLGANAALIADALAQARRVVPRQNSAGLGLRH